MDAPDRAQASFILTRLFIKVSLCLISGHLSANSAPTDINASNLTIAENSVIGTIIGEFNATDPDGEGNFTYHLKYNFPEQLDPVFWMDASDSSTIAQSSELVSNWLDKSGNENHLIQGNTSAQGRFVPTALNSMPSILFDGVNDNYKFQDSLSIQSIFMVLNTTEAPVFANWRWPFGGKTSNNEKKAFLYGRKDSANLVGGGGNISLNGGPNVSEVSFAYDQNFKIIHCSQSNLVTRSDWYVGLGDAYWKGHISEVISFSNLLSENLVEQVEAYLGFKWGLESNLPSEHPAKTFSVDQNGTLTANQTFDYETDDRNYTITVWATDDHNASYDKNFTITVTNVVEDLDGDGTEDHYDDDIDGDGLTNAEELAYNSDPWDASSVNRPPSDINASNLTIAENSAIGTIIGEFNATDPDGEGNFSFSVKSVFADPSNINGLNAWFDASDLTTIVTEEGSSDVVTWANKLDASVKMHGSTQKPNTGASINGLNALNFDFNSSGYERMFAYKNLTSPWSAVSLDGNVSGTYQDVAVFILYQIDHFYPNAMPFGFGWNGHFSWGSNGGVGGVGTVGSFYLDTPSRINMELSSAGSTQVVSINYSNTKSERAIYLNGTLKASSSNVSVRDAEQFNFPNSHHPDNTPNPWGKADYTLGEILVVNEVISDNDRQQIEGYLASKWGLVDQLPDSHLYSPNHLFYFDENGSLRTVRSLDYEVDEHNYTILVEVLDDSNASYFKDFNITLTNVVEDLDGDGTENHYDLDIDGDGLTNADELAYNSDPWDASSSNRPPSDINASNLTIAENSSIGTVIGELNATDPDGDLNITYQMLWATPKVVTSQENLLAWFKFDEANGTTTRNYGMVGSDGSLVNGALFERSEYKFGGGALKIPAASTARVTLDSAVGIGGEESGYFSLSVWFKNLHDRSRYRTLATGEEYNVFVLVSPNFDNLGVYQTNNGTFRDSGYDLNVSSTLDWTNLVATFDGSTTKMYLNSVLVGSCDRAPGTNIHDIGNNLGSVQPFAEYLDDFRVYEHPLSSTEVASIYGNGLGDYNAFNVDVNGTLRTAELFDFEDDSNFSVSVRAFDEAGTFVDKNFSIVLSNVVEDLDGDGIEDHNDTDADEDGVSNLLEYLGRSDPMDVNSTNRRPSDINASVSLSVEENASVGTIIAEFNATDLDPNSSIHFAFAPSFPSSYSPKLWLDAMDLFTLDKGDAIGARGPPENNQSIGIWQDKSGNNHHAVAVVGTPTYEENRINNSFPAVSTTRDVMLLSDTNSSFDGWDSMTISLVYQWPAGVELHQWQHLLSKGRGDWEGSAWILRTMNQNAAQGTGFSAGTGSAYKRLDGKAKTMAQNAKILTLVYNGSAGTVFIYSNGHYASSSTGWPASLRANAENSIALSGAYDPFIDRFSSLSSNSFGEILIFREAVSGDYRQRLEGYFAHKWGLSNDVEPFHPYKEYPFFIDANGTLKTTAFLDYETKDKNYSITVRAIDEWNATLEKQFTVLVTDVFEDLDGDGVEDHNDTDLDGDGVSNLDEYLWGSNPSDGNDVNHRPSNITPQGSVSIAENSAVGSLVGQFSGVDAEGNESLNLSMLHFIPKLWLDATSPSNFRTNLGVDSDYPADGAKVGLWLDKSGGSYHAKEHFDENRPRSEFMPTYRESGFNGGLPGLEFNSSMMVVEHSASDFDGWDRLTIYAVVQELSRPTWTFWFGKSETPGSGSNASWWFVPRRLDLNPSFFDFRFYQSGNSDVTSLVATSNLIHQPGVLVASIRGDSAVMKYNGTQVAYSNGSTVIRNSPDVPITIGATSKAGSKGKFLLSEFIVLNDEFNDEEIEWMEARLAYKWDVNGSLPTAHPYANTAPPNYPPGSTFYLEDNGTLRTTTTFDYETDDRNYSITVRATDDHYVSFDKNFTISVTNVVEDLDGDGTEDHYDLDIDGDGLTNAEELVYNSDPWDANSSNRPPSDINASNLTIAENAAIGAVIGEFNATDPDGDTNITFSILNGSGSEMGWSSSRLFGDSDSGVSPDLNYTCAVNVNGSNKVVNGVTFLGTSGTSGDGWAITAGFKSLHSSETSSVSGNIGQVLSNGFRHSGNPQKIKMTGLTVGRNYVFSLYNQGWGVGTSRSCSLSCSALSGSVLINQDKYGDQNPDGHLVRCFYTANAEEVEFTFNPVTSATWHLYAFSNHEGIPFALDDNGTLTTLKSFDYETDDLNYSITVRATDDHNVSFDKNFTISVTNVVEDLDGDGTEDHYDDDIDGDGLSDADEAMLGSDPLNGSSPVVPATSFKPKNTLTVSEDAAVGTVVGQFERLVDSASPFKSYELIPHLPTSASPVLWLDASELNYAGETWQERSSSNNHATRNGSAQGFPTILKNFQNGHSVMHYSGAQKAYHDFQEIGDVRTVFWVVGRSSGSGSLLGDSDSSQFFSGTEQFWLNGMADSKVLSGDTFLRGRKIDGSSTPVPSSLEVISFRSSADLNASRFGRSSNGRAFIGELGELIIFNQSLANWQMAQIERYLAQKWSLPIDRSTSEFSIDAEGVVRSAIKFNFDDTSSRSLLVRATNENNQSVINSHMVAITDVTGGASVSDIDGDGMSNELELTLGYDPYDANSKNTTPANLRSSNDLGILESVSVGSVIGKLIADDPDYLSELTYSFSTGEGAGDNSKVSISEGGEIKLLTSLDYEKQTSLSFRVKVLDENNASIEKAFTLSVIDVFEDENNNGVEDHLDSDMDGDGIPNESDPDRDGDGVSNEDEIQNGSDPDNAKSTNRPPTDLVNSSALSIQENQPKGAVISKFVPQDPDGVQGYSYQLVEGTGGTDNGLFEIDQHGNLSTAVVFDYENNASSYSVRMKAEDPYGKSVEKAFSIALTNSDQFSPISIDADLMLWLDASDKSTLEKSNSLGGAGQPKDGEPVKFWADKSGQGHHAITSNSGTYLENSLNEYYPSIDTTGDTFELVDSAESFDAWSEMTISMVYQYSSESSWILGIWKHGKGNGNHIQGGWSFDRMNMNNRTVGLWWAKASIADGEHAARLMGGDSFGSKQSAKVITIRYDGSSTNLKYFANGRFIKESNETEPYFVSNLSETLKIGNSYKWGEILIFKNALPDVKRELIEGYLAHKWGMASELDEEHAFYENPVVAEFESYEANFSNSAPSGIYLELEDEIQEGRPLGSMVNSIGVVDPDLSKSFEYVLVSGEGDEQNSFFKLSEDGELITSKAIDYEQHTELSFRVKVSDDHNESFSKALTITVVNVVEDADNDGIEDHEDPSIDTDQDGIEDSHDSDIDGDGMSNSEEIANGSNPRDANSINHAPSSISSVATLSFRENEPAGILVGQLSAVDEDDGASHEFFLVAGEGDTDNSLFTLSESGELRTAHTFDYDKNASSYSICVQAQDEYFASIENNFTVSLENDVWLSPQHLGDNLMLWLDASDTSSLDKGEKLGDLGPPENANGVGFWADKSGKEHNARPRPIYNKPKWKSAGFNQLPGIDFASSMMAIDNSAEAFDAWSELALFAVLEHDDVNFSPLFGKTNYAGWMSNDKDMSWAIFTHRLDGNYNHWGPAVITNTPANYYGSSPGSKALQVNDGGGPGILMFSYRSGRMIMHINGEQKLNHTGLTGAIQAKPDLDITIGGYHNGSNKQKMRLGELMIFNDVLTAENVKKVEGQLAHKWALTHVLPSSHTYEKTLNLDGSISFVENLPATTVIGAISDIDPDYNSSLDYSLSEANLSNDNHLFTVDSSGNISVSSILDYESNATQYTISTLAKDGSIVKSSNIFTLYLSNADEDFDNDGFSNQEEEAYGSDPQDKDSIPNGEPTIITGSLSVAENAEVGTVVGTVSTVDPDNHDTYSYSLVSRSSSSNIRLWLDANDSNSILQKDGKVYEWRDLSGRGNHAKQPDSAHQPTLVEDRIQFDGNDIMQVRDDALRLSIPGIVVVAKWDASVTWGNTIAGYHGESGIGWKLSQYSSSFNKLTFTSFGTTGSDNPNSSQTTTQSDYFICSSFREDDFRYLRHNSKEVIKIGDENYINYPGSDYGKSGIGGYFGGTEYSNPNGFLRGSIKELIVFEGKKSHEIDRLERYLANKWGIEIDGPIDELNNEEFEIDGDGVIKTKVALDYEEDANRTIRIRATDPYGEFIEKELVVSLSNVVEDIDGDGIEDAIDEDADGDGIDNETELDNGSDPYDAQSKNQLPTGISASGALTISENADDGTQVGNFTGTDPDAGQSLKFGLVADYPEHLSPTLWLDANASGSIDMNRSYVMSWSDKRGGASLIQDEESRQPQMTDLELNELPVVEFLGNDYMYSNGVFPLSPTFTMFAVAGFDWVNSASDALVSYDSFSGGGFMQWDAGNAHRFESRVWHHSNSGSLTSHKFYPQSDMGPALYQVSFNYEMGTMHGLLNGQSLGKTDYQTALHPRHVLRLFANNDLNQFPKGFVAEFMVFEEALSAVDRKLVESYLGEKWALPMHDPIEHPLFKMEENGTLVTREELDFETDENHTITVRVFDEYNASYDKDFLVTVTNVVEDLDGDGIENHYDTDDDNDSILDDLDPDDDNDGFSDTDEIAYGSNPLDPNSVANAFPNYLDLNSTTIFENQPIGTRVGQLIAHDPDGNALLVFRLVDGNGSDDNSLFVIDENASVRTTTMFDYETDDHNYSIRVGVADEHNFSIERSFTINLLNIVEDNDQDGVEDHYDPDDDNDGFSDLDEQAYGSDPLDPNSVANAAPDSLELNGTTVLENQPISALVGQLIGHDPDGNTTLTFSFVDGNGSDDNSLFIIDENATVRTTTMFDYETDDHNYSIRVGVSDEHNFSIERSFTINLLNIVEDHDQDGVEDHYDPDDDNDGFSDLDELNYGSDPLDSKSVANAAPDSLELNGSTVLENLPIGSLVGELIGYDPDENTHLTYRFVDGNGSGDNSLFVIDENASVRTTTIFDYESDDHNYSILVRIADEHNFSIDRTFTLLLLNENEPPFDFKSSADLEVKENQAMGSLVGKLTAKDPDMDSVLHFNLVEGAKDNHLFRIDNNGSLFTGAVFDFETNSSFEIRAKVRDRYNLWIKQNFTIKVLNIIEDFDKDGTENHYDLDDDNDGFSDAAELAYGSDPQDPESLANSTPDLLKLNGSTIMENQPIGTIIGRLVGHDPDPYATLSYSQVLEGNGYDLHLDVGPMGVVRTTKLFDYESNDRNYTLVARVTDEHNFSTERSFTIDLVNQIEDLDQDGVEDVYDEDIDGDGFSNEDELAYGSDPYDLRSVVNVAPIDIVIEGGEIEENRPTGTLVARFFGIDADKNDSLTYQLVGPGNIEESLPFKLSKRGGLRTTRKLDYELDKHDYSMTIQVLDDMNESFEKSFTIYLINQIEDIDGDGTEDAYDDDLDGDGYANELELEIGTNPTDRYSRPEKPILRAGSGQIDKNGTIFLTGGIKANGGAEISDFGFVLSSSVSLDRDKSTVYWVRGVGKAKDFKLTVTESPFPGTLYFRTWARNVAGYGIGPVKKVIIPEAPQPWWGEVEEAAGGWLTSSWFGTFKYYENGWLYHSHLGWLYSSPSNENSVWLWIEGRGWMWTKESAWPYLWWHNTNDWLYLAPSKPGQPLKFYDYSTQSY